MTGIGFTCYFLSMEITSAQTTSLVFFFKPALAPLLAFLVLHEAIPGNMLAGIACILCGSLGVHPPRPARAAKGALRSVRGRHGQGRNRSLNLQSLRPQRSLRAVFYLLHKIRLDIPHMLCYCLNRLIQRHTILTGGGIMNWNIRNDAPVYTQLVDQIARAIILGQFRPGASCRRCATSRPTPA